jgi:hypothetical protein
MAEEPRTATASTFAGSPALQEAAGADAELAPGTLLADRYRIDRRLGAGGMGVVHAATDIQLGRTVAVKLVRPRVDSPGAQERLVREARAMARLRHPNVATVHDIGTVGDRLFIVMELIDGGTLADWLRAGRHGWRQVLAAFLPAAHGLAAAHAAGFVHRDFKPENVLRGTDGVVRVSDFGVARLLGDAEAATDASAAGPGHTRDGALVGTPGYIAPEVLRHEPVDARADQFSFCVALYTALYGVRAFPPAPGQHAEVTDTLGPLPSPPSGRAPRWLAAAVRRGLASDPGARWPSMAALVAAIERRVRWRGRARASAVVTVLAAGAVAAYLGLRPPPPPRQWTPLAIGQMPMDSPFQDVTVSRDGSTLAYTTTQGELWVEPRAGGERRHVRMPPELGVPALARLTRRGDGLVVAINKKPGEAAGELWDVDVASGTPHLRTRVDGRISQLDVGPDGEVLASLTAGGDRAPVRLVLVDPTGGVRVLREPQPGGSFHGPVISPDGRRAAVRAQRDGANEQVEIVELASGRRVGSWAGLCFPVDWLSDASLVCGAMLPDGAELLNEVAVPSEEREPSVRQRLASAPYVNIGTVLRGTEHGLFFTSWALPQRLHAVDLDRPGSLRPLVTGSVADLPVAGWTPRGTMIFGASLHGHLQILEERSAGDAVVVHPTEAADVPLMVLGDAIIFGRFPGGEAAIPRADYPYGRFYPRWGFLFRLGPGGELRALGPTNGFVALRCAGDRALPCLLFERDQSLSAHATQWDPETGARSREVLRFAQNQEIGHALAPDGHTLARAVTSTGGSGVLELIDLDGGAPRRPALGAHLVRDLTFAPDGAVIATGCPSDCYVLRIREGAAEPEVLYGPTPAWLVEPRVRPDGKEVVFGRADTGSTLYWVDHPLD